MLNRLFIAISVACLTMPAAAQQGAESQRVIAALRQNDCRATMGDLGRMEDQFGLTPLEMNNILVDLRDAGGLVTDEASVQLTPSLCHEDLPPTGADFALATQINGSERAGMDHILALFAENGCAMSTQEYGAYLDQKFPMAAAESDLQIGEARFMLEMLPSMLLSDGLLERTADPNVVTSKGPHCG